MDDDPEAVAFNDRALGRILLSTHLDRCGEPVDGELDLRRDEGVIIEISPESGS